MENTSIHILAIESSCDDTSAAVLRGNQRLSNVVATQKIHEAYGGVVPELASRAHQQNIVPVVDQALKQAGIDKSALHAIAFTRGPGLMGSLLVGTSFAKSLSLGLDIPLIEVNHMQGHVLAHFIKSPEEPKKAVPKFPFLALTISGGHTQIILVKDYFDMDVLGETLDDAVGEAFDKAAKMLGLGYPGGPKIDQYAALGNLNAFEFPIAEMPAYSFSFSGIKTSLLYFIQKHGQEFVEENITDICASYQKTLILTLVRKIKKASKELKIKEIAVAGGVSANRGLREALKLEAEKQRWNLYIPDFQYCTDNAAMIAMAAHYKYLASEFSDQKVSPMPRFQM